MELFRRVRTTIDPSEVVKSFLAARDDTSTPDADEPASNTDKGSILPSALSVTSFGKGAKAQLEQGSPTSAQHSSRSLTVPHRIVTWPYIYQGLTSSGIASALDLQSILQEGTAWFVKGDLWKHPDPLPPNIGLYSTVLGAEAAKPGRAHVAFFPALTVHEIQTYSDAYFGTFNTLYPLLDEETFKNEVTAVLLQDGLQDGDFVFLRFWYLRPVRSLWKVYMTGRSDSLATGQAAIAVVHSITHLAFPFSMRLAEGWASYRRIAAWKMCRSCFCRLHTTRRLPGTLTSGAQRQQHLPLVRFSYAVGLSIGRLQTVT